MDLLRDRPLRQKMIVVILVASGFGLLLVAAAMVVYEVTTFRPRVLAELTVQADVLRASLHAPLAFTDRIAAEESLRSLAASPEIRAAVVYERDGRPFTSYLTPDADPGSLPAFPPSERARFAGRQLDLVQPIDFEGELLGHLLLRRDLPPLFERLPQYGLMVAAVLLALLTASLLLSAGLQRIITAPIVELGEAAKTVRDRQDYSVRVERRGRDEIGDLTEAFHQMLETIRQRETALREALGEVEEGRQELQHELQGRRRVEAALRESERFNQKIADSMPSLLYVQDIEDRRNTYVNREAETILGFPVSQIVGDGPALLEIPHPDDPAVLETRLARLAAAEDGDIVETEYRMRRADGSHRWLNSRDTVFERAPDGRTRLVLGVAQDVTERKALQDQLIQAQKMESIGRLAGGVAHDFNNLLTVIVGSIDLVQMELGDDHPTRAFLRNAQQATSQAADLTHQLLAFARRQIIEPRVVDLNDVVLDAEKMLRSLVGESVELAVVTQPGLLRIKADPSQMIQVLMNLAVNARDAMPGGGTLTVQTGNEQVAPDRFPGVPAGSYVSLTVTDTGVGMSEHVKGHLFEPFFTTKETGKGTGLGLATCYGVVKQSGGFVTVESELGRGSSFTVLLPSVEAEPVARRGRGTRTALPSGEETVLIVEDNPLVRATAFEMLRARGYTVLEAASGPDALRLVDGYPGVLDLLITDVVMPQMGGQEVAERLGEMRPGLRVLFVSGYTSETLAPPRGATSVAFLQKPYTSERLIRKVREVLDA